MAKKKKIKSPYRIRWGRLVLKTGLAISATVALGGTYYVYNVLQDVPTIREDVLKSDSSVNMYAKDGTLIYSSAKYKRQYIPIEEVPQEYIDLLLSTEDREFYEHKGFSPRGFANAVLSYGKEKLGKGEARGGSGIEQQLIKLSVFSIEEKDRTVDRKLKELFLATQFDKNYSKDKILEFYINKIFLGENAYGVRTISHVYFNKDLKDLSLSQLAILAGLGQSPGYYNLYDSPELVEERRNIVLKSTLDNEKITKAQYDEAIKEDVTEGLIERYSQAAELDEVTKQHNGFISSALNQIEELGYDMDKTPLQITTTLDIDVENKVRNILDNRTDLFQDDLHQAAVTVIDPQTGEVLSEVGGRFANEIGGLNRATSTVRSSGSAIKPILDYGPAIEYFNWATNKILDGSPYTYPGTNITAYDYGGVTHGDSEMKLALRQSYNTPAIRTLDDVGEVRAKEFLSKLGINTDQVLAGSRAIGLDVSPTQIASAMGTFGQKGIHHQTKYVSKIEFPDKSEKEINFEPVQAMRESTAYIMTEILKGVPTDTGTMRLAKIPGITQASKSGTVGYDSLSGAPSGASMDLWHVGYTKSLSIAVWQGYDKPMENFLSQYFSINYSAYLYKNLMETLSAGRDNSDWEKPDTVTHLDGNGLNANYVPNDLPLSETEKSLEKPLVNARESYPPANFSEDEVNSFTKEKPTTPSVPENWKKESWKKELESEKNTFYEQHKNDKEEAAKLDEE